ncbi:MAG: response regulator [Hyphomonadaceae bacterium]|nr:MAG: integral membrane sensor hybrid histidine kinase [Caulobacteraceae bacterium]MBT9447641.1 response regulator [Hyphomonadaceae bacterium]
MRLTRNDGIWTAAIGASWVLASFDLLSPRMQPDNVALFWLPNAVLAVAMLRRINSPPLLALFCATAIAAAAVSGVIRSNESALGWAVLAVANCVETGLLAFVVSRQNGDTFAFTRPRAVAIWTGMSLCASTASMLIAWAASNAGMSPVRFAGSPEPALNWIFGDTAAHLTLGAMLVVATSSGARQRFDAALREPRRVLAMIAAVLVSSVIGFAGPQLWDATTASVHPGYLALLVPALMWTAFHYGPGGAAAAALMSLGPGIALTVAGWGPFYQHGEHMALDLQVMIVAMAASTLLVGVLGETLREARDRAAAADRAKTLFISRIGHELRTPLNGVIGAADLLARNLADAPVEQQDRLDLVRSSARTLAAVVEDLVEFAAMHREGVSIRPVTFEARRPFDDAVAIYAPRAQWNGVELRLEQKGLADAWIVSDPARLRQILFALVGNAVEATVKGEIVIEATLTTASEHHAQLRIVVHDTGSGIPPERQAEIFAPFQQGSVDRNRPSLGLGLGLAVAKETVDAFGGSISLESTVGAGSSFIVELPVTRADPPSGSAIASGRAHALLAEDNPTGRIVLSAMLTSLGFDVVSVETGAEAVAAASRNDFELIVMDIQMPVMDGEEAMQRIRAIDGARGKTPIIVVTAHALAGDEPRYRAMGADDVVAKPVDLRAMAAAVSRVLA